MAQALPVQILGEDGNAAKVNSSGALEVDATLTPSGTQDVNITQVGGNAVTTSVPVTGSVAAGVADSGNPVKAGGKYNTTLPTLADGQRGDLQLDTRGGLIAVLKGSGSTNSVSATTANADSLSVNTVGIAALATGYLFDGSSAWARSRALSGAVNTGVGTQAAGLTKLSGSGLTKVTVNITTATTTAVIAGVSAQLVRVYKIMLNFANAQTLNIITSGGGSLVGAPMSFGQYGGLALDFDGEPWFTTVVAEGLSFVTTTTGVVTGVVYYRQEA